MNGGHVERIFAAADAQETGRLFERLGSETGDGLQCHAGLEATVVVPKLDDLLRGPLADSRDVAQQGPGRGVEIDADPIHA